MRWNVHLLQSSFALTHYFSLLYCFPLFTTGSFGRPRLVETTRMAHQYLAWLFVHSVATKLAIASRGRTVRNTSISLQSNS